MSLVPFRLVELLFPILRSVASRKSRATDKQRNQWSTKNGGTAVCHHSAIRAAVLEYALSGHLSVVGTAALAIYVGGRRPIK